MWRYFRKRRALRAYRTTLVKQLRLTYGRKLYYSVEEVQTAVRDLRGAAAAFDCYAFAMFCERQAFDAHHAARGESCDYDAMRSEVFAHVANVVVSAHAGNAFAGSCATGDEHVPGHAHHDGGHHAAGHHDVGGHHDAGSHHDVGGHGDVGGGHDFGGGGGGFDGGHHH